MKNKNEQECTHFGFRNVSKDEKTYLVSNIFHTVASKYDLMNDLMSFGIHRIWKQFTIYNSGVFSGCKVLDLAGGTGDLSIQLSRLVGSSGVVALVDINDSMLHVGRKKIRNLGILNNIVYIQADAEELPFPTNTFDCVVVAFGLRNFTNKERALLSMYRVLKSKGKLLILDFGVPIFKALNRVYNLYSFHILPKIGKLITQNSDSYRYLVESIRMHPSQETLKNIIIQTGFHNVEYFNMTFGIAVLHCAYKR